jgi:haloalkane dehalogenase
VVAPDLLGFGRSSAPAVGADFSLQAQSLRDLLEHLRVDSFRLVVHDWGGPIALGCVAERPAQLRQLVLINTTVLTDFQPPAYWRPFVGRWLGELVVVRLNAVAWVLPTMMRAARSRALRRVYLEPLRSPGTRRTVLALEQLRGYAPLMARVARALPELQVPTLLLWGQPDPYFRAAEIERLEALFEHVTRRVLPGAGHFPQEDAPEQVTHALEQFLA